jgi:hypothetical protein
MKTITDLILPKVGRKYQHIEDLMLVSGAAGAFESLDLLRQIASGHLKVEVKWDGVAVVRFRKSNGIVFFGDKHTKELLPTPWETYNSIFERTKSERYALMLKTVHEKIISHVIFDIEDVEYEAGLLLVSNDSVYIYRGLTVKPNTVSYMFDDRSSLLGGSTTVSLLLALTGPSKEHRMMVRGTGSVILIPPVMVRITDDYTSPIEDAIDYICNHAESINFLLSPRPKFNNLNEVFYRYDCKHSVSTQPVYNAKLRFIDWIHDDRRLSLQKKKTLVEILTSDHGDAAFRHMRYARYLVQHVKNNILPLLNARVQQEYQIYSSISCPDSGTLFFGGEGFVGWSHRYGDFKLVNRTVFTMINKKNHEN